MTQEKNKYTKVEFVEKILGNFKSIGSTEYDEKAYDNLEDVGELVCDLIYQLVEESKRSEEPQCSVNKSAKKCLNILQEVTSMTKELLKE